MFVVVDASLDWAANFAYMMGYDFEVVKEFMWLYMIIYVDYEGGNVLVYVMYLVGSVLSDLYFSFVVGLNGFVGSLYGLVN